MYMIANKNNPTDAFSLCVQQCTKEWEIKAAMPYNSHKYAYTAALYGPGNKVTKDEIKFDKHEVNYATVKEKLKNDIQLRSINLLWSSPTWSEHTLCQTRQAH